MRIWVLGGGAIGLLYAAKLRASGADVLLLTRTREQAAKIAASGIEVRDEKGSWNIPCVSIAVDDLTQPGELGDEAPEWILLTVKQYGITEGMLAWLASLGQASPRMKLLAMQNGLGHLERLAAHVPPERLYAAVVSEGALRTGPASVQHTGSGVTKIGAAASDAEGEKQRRGALKDLQKVLQNAGFQSILSKQLIDDLWHKLIINSVINPLTALLGIPNGELIEHQSLLTVMRQLMEEARTVAARSGAQADDSIWESILEVCRRTASNRSSMLQDLEAGRPTELRWINGAVVEAARRYGLSVPTHETILQLVQAKERIR